MRIHTCLSPRDTDQELLEGSTVVVIDALRMTSVAATAIANGCAGILPVAEVEDARRGAAELPDALLCGERKGMRLAGFVLGNSPLAYTRERVHGKRLISTTTNGTRALGMASSAKQVVVGAFLNARAVAEYICGADKLVILCAGTHDRLSLEDVLAAGCILAHLRREGSTAVMDDASAAALRLYEGAKDDLHGALMDSAHCRYLLELGGAYTDDVRYCAQCDILRSVPVMRDGWIIDGQV